MLQCLWKLRLSPSSSALSSNVVHCSPAGGVMNINMSHSVCKLPVSQMFLVLLCAPSDNSTLFLEIFVGQPLLAAVLVLSDSDFKFDSFCLYQHINKLGFLFLFNKKCKGSTHLMLLLSCLNWCITFIVKTWKFKREKSAICFLCSLYRT